MEVKSKLWATCNFSVFLLNLSAQDLIFRRYLSRHDIPFFLE